MEGKEAPKGYFDSVVSFMVRAGFALISRVTIDKSDARFHVAAGYARNTSLFFHVVGKSIIVQMSFNENDCYRDFFYGAWSVEFHTEFLPGAELLPLTAIPRGPDEWETSYKLVPGQDERLELEGFWHYGSKLQENPTPVRRMVPERLAAIVKRATDLMLPFLDRGRFDKLQVTSFPPTYVFPGCEQEFWERFDTSYFRSIVRRPWGSGEREHRSRLRA